MSENKVNICCVGDDDQSIYGWRGAEVDNILRFEKDFPGATVIRLERNYRSTAHILGTASHLIAHNEGRLGKTLFTDRTDPEDAKVIVHAAWDSEQEARDVGDEIESAQREGHKLNDMAILVRASFQMREFEDRFVTLGLNYRVIGGPRFYERQEIRDALAYLRVVAQGADDLAFERIVNVPKRGLGEAAIRQVHDTSRALRIPMLEAAGKLAESDELKPKPRAALRQIAANFTRWQGLLEVKPHTELAEIILEESGYTEMWKNDRSAEAPGRLENLKELIRSMEEYESLRSFLEHVALVMDAEQNAELDAVNIMTLHSAKGLEFETVFLPGWEEGLFPHQRALDEGGRSGLEEERRLAYVGPDAGQAASASVVRLQPPHPRPVAIDHPVALPRRTAGGACRGGRRRQFLWRLRLRPLWRRRLRIRPRQRTLRRLALRQGRALRQHLRHARAGSAPRPTAPRRRATIGAAAPATRSSASAMARPIPATAPAAPASRAA